MKYHRGEALKNLIKELRPDMNELAKAMNLHKRYIYDLYKKELLDFGKIRAACIFMNVDPLTRFPDFPKELKLLKNNIEDSNLKNCEKELIELRKNYSQLQEKYIRLLENELSV